MNKELKMLSVNDCWRKIEESQVIRQDFYGNKEFINMQPIDEKLLRLACKWTDNYASDILIFFEFMKKYFLEESVKEIDFYFRNNGVEWVTLAEDNTIRPVMGIPDRYRGMGKLIFDGQNMILYWQQGNC
jgi:hypothetical protein